jgi:hypothetical protein
MALVIDQNEATVGCRFAEADFEQFRSFHVGERCGVSVADAGNRTVIS